MVVVGYTLTLMETYKRISPKQIGGGQVCKCSAPPAPRFDGAIW